MMFRTEKPWVRVYEGQASPETQVYEGSLTDFFRSSVEEHRDKTPKIVEFRDELPKSTVGKLLRRVLADEEKARASTKAIVPN